MVWQFAAAAALGLALLGESDKEHDDVVGSC